PTTPPAKEPEPNRESAVLGAPVSQKVGRVDIVVDHIGVVSIGDVVKTCSHGKVVIEEPESPLKVGVQGKIRREPPRARRPDQLLILVEQAERVSVTPFQEVRDRKLLD